MTSKDYSVQALGTRTYAGSLAYNAAYGDFIRLIKSKESFQYDRARIREEIRKDMNLQDAAQAFLAVFDRYRAFLAALRDRGVKDRIVNNLFNCPPSGVILAPEWHGRYFCKKLICPWCGHRQVLELAKAPWVPLNTEVHVYTQVYEARSFLELNEVRKRASQDRHRFLRRVTEPFIRFQRVGLEMRDGTCHYRLLQLVVFKVPVKAPETWESRTGTYDRALETAFRFSAANLIKSDDWGLFADLLGLNRLRRAEPSRG